jgi:hypothetical protein
MTQSDLNRAVARQTGESKRCIRRMGFTLLIPAAPLRPRSPAPQREGEKRRACPD